MNNYIFVKARQCGTDRRQYLLEMMPKLAEIYRQEGRAHLVIDMLEYDISEKVVFNLIEQLTLQNIDLHNMLIKAIEQGFNPQKQ